jgi:hypothetical protein
VSNTHMMRANNNKTHTHTHTHTHTNMCAAFHPGTDACVSPVLEAAELPQHAHSKERCVMLRNGAEGQWEPAPAPRLSRSAAQPVRLVGVTPSPKGGC